MKGVKTSFFMVLGVLQAQVFVSLNLKNYKLKHKHDYHDSDHDDFLVPRKQLNCESFVSILVFRLIYKSWR